MPLIRVDLISGRTDRELQRLLDVLHGAMVEAFGVPMRDRYQIVTEHEPSRLLVEDTGLGYQRTSKVVIVQITTRPRTREQKQRFYELAVERLSSICGVPPSDVVVSCVVNDDEDWSFGLGRAQFLTGEL